MENYQEILLQLIERAKTEKHTEFHMLVNWYEYTTMKAIRKTLKMTVVGLRKSIKKILTNYCVDIKQGKSKVESLMAYSLLYNTYQYYEKELEITNNIIWEYEAYLTSGHHLWAFLGEERTKEDMWDHRGIWP